MQPSVRCYQSSKCQAVSVVNLKPITSQVTTVCLLMSSKSVYSQLTMDLAGASRPFTDVTLFIHELSPGISQQFIRFSEICIDLFRID